MHNLSAGIKHLKPNYPGYIEVFKANVLYNTGTITEWL